MLKNAQRVRNVAHNVIEKVLHDFDFEIEIKFKIYNDGVKFIVIKNKSFHEIACVFESFISHLFTTNYKSYYEQCLRTLKYDILQRF